MLARLLMLHTAKLLCHPAASCAAISALHASVRALADGGLQLRFQLQGKVDALCIPTRLPGPSTNVLEQQRDELWRHTCFEVFVATAESAYREFNFSPAGQWAAYAFTDYRQRDMTWQPAHAPQIVFESYVDGLTLDACIPAALLPVISSTPTTLHVGLTAVIEASDTTLSYWALVHLGERPDFHQRAGFVLEVAYDSHLASRTGSSPTDLP